MGRFSGPWEAGVVWVMAVVVVEETTGTHAILLVFLEAAMDWTGYFLGPQLPVAGQRVLS